MNLRTQKVSDQQMKEIYGNLSGISRKHLTVLQDFYEYTLPPGQIGDEWLCQEMLRISETLNKEVAVYINRSGQITMVAVGQKHSASIPLMTEKRSTEGLKRLGCLHTHPSGNSQLSSEDLQTLEKWHLDFMCAIASADSKIIASVAMLQDTHQTDGQANLSMSQQINAETLFAFPYLTMIREYEKSLEKQHLFSTSETMEKAILFIPYSNLSEEELYEQTEEFKNLAESAGLIIIDVLTQNIKNSRSVMGKGKVDELQTLIREKNPECLLIDAVVSPSQESSLSEELQVKIIDRTNLILDIFAQRAKSNEGKLQVELAQLKYLLPRIMGQGLSLSRLGGGVGTRGPGETKLETDRRHIRRRITILEKQLDQVKQRRSIQKQNRIKKELPLVSLVGYTNAGKSSLLNALCDDSLYAENLLFATLDTTTRALTFPDSGNKILLTDTVGFISHLPHQLISAFKSTLEEVLEADLLLHVIDISNSNWRNHIEVVEKIFADMGMLDKDMFYVFNKSDLVQKEDIPVLTDKPTFFVSSKTGEGLDELRKTIDQHFYKNQIITVFLPYSESKLLSLAHKEADVLSAEHLEQGTKMTLSIASSKINLFSAYIQ